MEETPKLDSQQDEKIISEETGSEEQTPNFNYYDLDYDLEPGTRGFDKDGQIIPKKYYSEPDRIRKLFEMGKISREQVGDMAECARKAKNAIKYAEDHNLKFQLFSGVNRKKNLYDSLYPLWPMCDEIVIGKAKEEGNYRTNYVVITDMRCPYEEKPDWRVDIIEDFTGKGYAGHEFYGEDLEAAKKAASELLKKDDE